MTDDAPITILGSGGWIGSALVADLRLQGCSVLPVDRHGLRHWLEASDNPSNQLEGAIGPVIYAIGLTSDFRQRPHATAEAHVSLLSRVLRRPGMQRLLFLSSTRVYARCDDTRETVPLPCLTSDPSDLYNLSKLMGEALVLQDPRPGFKVVRLSNLVGPNQPATTFVGALLAAAKAGRTVTIEQPPSTAKDYVALADVVRLLPAIARRGQERLYNLGRGRNTSHAEVAAWLQHQGISVGFATGAEARSGLSFPPLAIGRLVREFEPPGDPFRQALLAE